MNLFKPIADAYKTLTGEREKEELLLLIKEWDELLHACTNRIEGLEKGYSFLRKNMFLKQELIRWRWLAGVSAVISIMTLLLVLYWIFKTH